MIIKFLFDSLFPDNTNLSEKGRTFNISKEASGQLSPFSLDSIRTRWLLYSYSWIYENTTLIERTIPDWSPITASFVYTYDDTDKWKKDKDKWCIYMIDVWADIFHTPMLLKPDRKDDVRNHIIWYIWLPIVIIFMIVRTWIKWDNVMELLHSLLNPYGVSEYLFLFLILVLIGYIWWWFAKKKLYKWIISVESQLFEKYFDIQSDDELWVREFFDPYRLQILADRIDTTPRTDGRKIVFIQNIIAVYISHKSVYWKIRGSTHSHLWFIENDIQHVEDLIWKLHIPSYADKQAIDSMK